MYLAGICAVGPRFGSGIKSVITRKEFDPDRFSYDKSGVSRRTLPASPPVSRRDGLIAGIGSEPGQWGGRRPLPNEPSKLPSHHTPGRPDCGTASSSARGADHIAPPNHTPLPPSCRRTWLDSTPKGSPLDLITRPHLQAP